MDLVAVPVRVVDVSPPDPAGIVVVRLSPSGPTTGPLPLSIVAPLPEALGLAAGDLLIASLRRP